MAEGASGTWPELIAVGRRGPVLRPSPSVRGVYGVDLTSGCGHNCVYCPVRSVAARAGEETSSRLPFDAFTAEAVRAALLELGNSVKTIVMSPLSDPFPPFRAVRAEAVRVAEVVFDGPYDLLVMSRGRFPRRMIELLSAHRDRARVALGLFSLNKSLVRSFEPLAASPLGRIRDLERLAKAGVAVEFRLEPLIPGLTDTRENLVPLFRRVRDAGVTTVVAHYLFQHHAIETSLNQVLSAHACGDRLALSFLAGPKISVGSMGTVRNLPREVREDGLARVMSWGSEFGLTVSTGSAQNPDLSRIAAERSRSANFAPTTGGQLLRVSG